MSEARPFDKLHVDVSADKRIKSAVRIYSRIVSLCQAQGYCWASNGFFAKEFDVSVDTINNWLKKLKEYGYITVEHTTDKYGVKYRIIKIIASDDNRESSDDNRESSDDNRESSDDNRESSDDNRESSDDNRESSVHIRQGSEKLTDQDQKRDQARLPNSKTEPKQVATPQTLSLDFETFSSEVVKKYVELTRQPILDLIQIPSFKNGVQTENLKKVFGARKYDALDCIKHAFDKSKSGNPSFKGRDFCDALLIYLSSGNATQKSPCTIKRYYTEKELVAIEFAKLRRKEQEKLEREAREKADKEFQDKLINDGQTSFDPRVKEILQRVSLSEKDEQEAKQWQ